MAVINSDLLTTIVPALGTLMIFLFKTCHFAGTSPLNGFYILRDTMLLETMGSMKRARLEFSAVDTSTMGRCS